MSERVHVFGVRHHGPGCARSVRSALEGLAPDLVLVEGPPDADGLLEWVGHEQLKPPVALLVHPVAEPGRGVFYPFAVFSPEWQALLWARKKAVSVRFMDLPQALRFGPPAAAPSSGDEGAEPDTGASDEGGPEAEPGCEEARAWPQIEPIAALARAAGYEDADLWWDHQVEQRHDDVGLFAAVLEAMKALRADEEPPPREEALREAWMRRTIRAALKEGHQRIAVICGAWHAPALVDLPPAKADDALLKNLPKVKVDATWVPWTHSRLARASGYGAGVTSPGWYAHLWHSPDRAPLRWAAQAARLLRAEDLDASSASVIETVRLAETLAAMRERPQPALPELREAALSVLCGGSEVRLALVRDALEGAAALGEVPPDAPAVPLQRDLETQQKTLRLKASGEARPLDLDLRKELDRARSRLLHRLRLLGIDWGVPQRQGGGKGTFHELWQLEWKPELVLRVVEASAHGTTVEEAATRAAVERAGTDSELPALAALLDLAILAALPAAVAQVLVRVQHQAALHAEVSQLLHALVPLARAARYGDVRGTDAGQVLPVIEGLFERALVGLRPACASLDDDAATKLVEAVNAGQEALTLLDLAALREEWLAVLAALCVLEDVHPRLRGRFARLRLDAAAIDDAELQRLARLSLGHAAAPDAAAAWVEGLVSGGALSLLQREGLWRALDRWMQELQPELFTQVLPALRRAFSRFAGPERRSMGEKVKRFRADRSGADEPAAPAGVDLERARRVLPVLAHLLGVKLG